MIQAVIGSAEARKSNTVARRRRASGEDDKSVESMPSVDSIEASSGERKKPTQVAMKKPL